jgi:hypothetical protein
MQPRCVRRHLRSPLSLNLKRRHLDASQRDGGGEAAIDGTVNDFSTLGSTQDSVEGVYLVLELIGRAQQVGGRCVGEAQPGDFMPSIIDALINRHPYLLSLLVRVPPRPAMMAAKRS